MDEEYSSLMVNDTWDLVPLPKCRKLVTVLDVTGVYRIKYGLDESVDNHKDQLVAKDRRQDH
jgi:hypothetical protein